MVLDYIIVLWLMQCLVCGQQPEDFSTATTFARQSFHYVQSKNVMTVHLISASIGNYIRLMIAMVGMMSAP